MRVAIVGLGAAGLRAAMLLKQAGVDVSLFEAKRRLGGRLSTVRQGELIYDAGGEWIDSDHERVLQLCGQLDLELKPSLLWPGRVQYQGEESTEDLLWPDALEDELRVEAAAREICRNLSSPPWDNRFYVEFERRTLADFIKENTRSERGRWWVEAKYRSDEGDDPKNIGLLGWLCGYMHYVSRESDAMSAFRIAGGAQHLCDRMIDAIAVEAHCGHILRRVDQSGSDTTVEFDQGRYSADRVILTMPPPVLEQVVFDPSITAKKRCAVEAGRMSRAIKIALHFEEPWWLQEDWNGRMLTDSPLQQTWDGAYGNAPVLIAYICGEQATYWTELGDPVQVALEELSRLYPRAKGHFLQGWIHDWPADPFARGAFSYLPPGYVLEHMEHVSMPEGRVHFAGEHTAMYTGFIEGALESAERVVKEVLNA